MEDLKKLYLMMLAVREDLPEETRDYVENELEATREENEDS